MSKITIVRRPKKPNEPATTTTDEGMVSLSVQELSQTLEYVSLGDLDLSDKHACLTAFRSILKGGEPGSDGNIDAARKLAHLVVECKHDLMAAGAADMLREDLISKGKKMRVLLAMAQITLACKQIVEPYFVPLLALVLDAAIVPAQTEMAELAALAIIKTCHAEATELLLPVFYAAIEGTNKFPKRVAALKALATMARLHQKPVARHLVELISCVSPCLTDIHERVSAAAKDAMQGLTAILNNPDLLNVLPLIVEATADYRKVPDFIKVVAATTFVRDIESPVLAFLVPLLVRSLQERSGTVQYRQTTLIISNICKLVPDPHDVTQFLPLLVPALERVKEMGADPELRQVVGETLDTISNLIQNSAKAVKDDKVVDNATVLNILSAHLSAESAVLSYVVELVRQLTNAHNFDSTEWQAFADYFKFSHPSKDKLAAIRNECFSLVKSASEELREQDHEELCNCNFSLGYGGMILLKDTVLLLKRGDKMGLVGKNGCGKTTMMKAIANGQLDGFPPADKVRTAYVGHTLQGIHYDRTVVEYFREHFPNATDAELQATLDAFDFTSQLKNTALHNLSGGWKMKVELANAMLKKADVLLLDEPTNHLDARNCAWLEKYLRSQTQITALIVSHDSGFLDNVCTHIIHYENKKLKTFKMNFTAFTELVPEAKKYLEYDTPNFAFNFPPPGVLEGVKSMNRKIVRLKNVEFQYSPTGPKILNNINIGVSLSSRVAITGPNGAGKSTLVKIMTGEAHPTSGNVQKHASLRMAYVAQHAFHHLEQHLESSPNAYIRWRFENGVDKELLAKETRQMSAEESAKKTEMNIECLCGRQKVKRTYKYEVKLVGRSFNDTVWVMRERLEELGFHALIQAFDDIEASRGGNYTRELTVKTVEQHLIDFGLDPEFGTHGLIKGLSGGQKVKVVLAAAMWLCPHILVMDEPTNYLDQQSLLALANAIKEYKGGVVLISHNSKFVSSVCNEFWQMNGGILTRVVDGQVVAEEGDDEAPGSETTSTTDLAANKDDSTSALSKEDKKERERKPARRKETRKERQRKEKVKEMKLAKYGPKPDGTPYSSDEEPEEKFVHI